MVLLTYATSAEEAKQDGRFIAKNAVSMLVRAVLWTWYCIVYVGIRFTTHFSNALGAAL